MEFQLVVQFRGHDCVEYDDLVALEDELISALGESANVDGHDIGTSEANIFVLTSDPEQTFQDIKSTIENFGLLQLVTVAFRSVQDETYTIIWPTNPAQQFHVT
jgi:hypothetical protein